METYLFVQKLDVGGVLVLDILFDLFAFAGPGSAVLPPFAIFILFGFQGVFGAKVLLRDLLPICARLERLAMCTYCVYVLLMAAGRVWKSRTIPCNSLGQPCCTLVGT